MIKKSRKPILSVKELVEYYRRRLKYSNPSYDSTGKVIEYDAVDHHNFKISIPSGSLSSDTLTVIKRDFNGDSNSGEEVINCTELKSQKDAFIYLAYFFGDEKLLGYDKMCYCCEVGSARINIEEGYIRRHFAELLKKAVKEINGIKVYIPFRRVSCNNHKKEK